MCANYVLGDDMNERFEELLYYALQHNATDIHFELKAHENNPTISMRTITGFKDYKVSSKDIRLMEYLKYVSNLDLMHINTPQSGSFTYIYDDKEYYFRVASIKSQFIEVCVVRILNTFYIDDNIFNDIRDDINMLLQKDYGLIVFSGPTGSGKTTSMYTLMQMYHDKKIYSIEDPIEIYFSNIIQININKNKNFGYKEAITQILRHDPDIICIGEIRDEEAAQMAVRAAFTGHLVLCTVHATNCELTLSRLLDLGVSQQDLENNLIFVGNQRLKVNERMRKSYYETLIFDT